MTRRRSARWTLGWIAALAIGQLAAAAPASATDLDEANRRWRGARCRTRQELTVKKDRPGWTDCEWLFWSPERGNSRVRVEVSDGASVHRAYRRGVLPVGTEFLAAGWAVEEGGSDLYLEIELVGLPVRARVYYYDDWVGRVSVNRLDDFERWARFDFLELVEVPSERLVEALPASSAGAPAPISTSAPPAPPPTPAVATGPPALQVLAVAVRPPRVPPGGEIAMIVTYEVKGVPPGSAFEVLEVREIYRGDQRLAGFEARVPRAADTFTSSQPLRLPPDLAPGSYSLRARVVMAGREASGEALFEVTPAP